MDQRLGADHRSSIRNFLIFLSVAIALLIWAHWTDLVETAQHWGQDAQYSHGYLVPAFALGLLYSRRALLQQASPAPAWWGIPILALGIGLGGSAHQSLDIAAVLAEMLGENLALGVAVGIGLEIAGR